MSNSLMTPMTLHAAKWHVICLIIFLILGFQNGYGQYMESHINSLADDEFAHPWDNEETPEDETTDGICMDQMGRCTFRAALEEAANIFRPAKITFGVQGTLNVDPLEGTFYPPDGSLITGINQEVTILGDGNNTPLLIGVGYNTLITGMHFTNALIGIAVLGNSNRIGFDSPLQANYVSDMIQNGILVAGDSNRITGNVIGLDLLGNAEGNLFGISVAGGLNVIGGIRPGEGNVISGNDIGISVGSFGIGTTFITGNQIGTNINGNLAIGNRVGIEVISSDVIIGNDDPNSRNIISGNTESGILIGIAAQNSYIQNNYIGIDRAGSTGLPNRDGITLGPGSQNSLVLNNIISRNTSNGILTSGILSGLESSGHLIIGNEISLNGNAGILVSGASQDIIVGSSLIDTHAPNEIIFNGSTGILFAGGFAGDPERNTVRKNSFEGNGEFGIRIILGQAGISPPVITQFAPNPGAGTATVTGTHDLAGSTIDIYAAVPNPSSNYEGIEWLGSAVTDANGDFIATVQECVCLFVVGTSTDVLGNTSQFSGEFSTMQVSVTENPGSDVLNAFPNPSNGSVTFQFSINQAQEVSLMILDGGGRLIESVLQERMAPGMYTITRDASHLGEGMYVFRLVTVHEGSASARFVMTH